MRTPAHEIYVSARTGAEGWASADRRGVNFSQLCVDIFYERPGH